MHSEANISMYDLHDSYLPQVCHWMIAIGYRWFLLQDLISFTRALQYEEAFKLETPPSGVMCSYTSINGTPSCSNDYILNQMMRKRWGAEHAFVSTDCGAVLNMMVCGSQVEDCNG